MRFSAYINLILYLITAVGLLSLSVVEELGAGFLVFVWVATVASLAVREQIGRVVPSGVWNVLAIVLFVAFLADYLMLSRSLVGSSARFLSLLFVLKLYDLKTTRDHLILYIIVFFELLSASASTTSPAFFGVLFLFTVSTIWAMIIFNIKRDSAEHGLSDPPAGLFSRLFFLGTMALTVLSLLITLVLFFIIPRMELHLIETQTLNTIKVSGFSDTVELGSMGTVKLDSTIVMRVSTPQSPPLYIRGAVLTIYRDGVWKREKWERSLVRRARRGVFLSGLKPDSRQIPYRIMLEPLDTEVLFSPPGWTKIEGRFTGIWTDPTGTLYLPSAPLRRIEYRLVANPHARLPAGPEGLSPYLEVPEELAGIRELAERVTEDATTALEKARAIEMYLKDNYTYSLSVVQNGSGEPIEDFLFNTRTGWCEQFSAGMVMMLRTLGIPARLVTGFAGGEWNQFGNYYIIRQKDAHTWVEAHIDGQGWMSFDPTPVQQVLSGERTSTLALYIDALYLRWYRYIINYSLSDQIRLARSLERGVNSVRYSAISALKGLKRGTPVGLTVAFAVVVTVLVVMALKRKGAGGTSEMPWFYREMTRILSKKGLTRLPHETPMEFALRTGIHEAIELTEFFEKVKYGRKTLSQRELERIKGLVESLRRKT